MNILSVLNGKPVKKFRHAFDATNVDQISWTQLIASMDKAASAVEIYNSSGAILKISTGTAGNEAAAEKPFYIFPNGHAVVVALEIPFGARLSAQAVGTDATSGDLLINFLG